MSSCVSSSVVAAETYTRNFTAAAADKVPCNNIRTIHLINAMLFKVCILQYTVVARGTDTMAKSRGGWWPGEQHTMHTANTSCRFAFCIASVFFLSSTLQLS